MEEEGDTDGVAVISDDEEASSSGSPTPDPSLSPFSVQPFLSSPPRPQDLETSSVSTVRDSDDELPEDFYLSEKKIKSYVHRRNNRVSNLLNIVLLGTVVTAVTLAVGFMWGINDTCSLDMLNSVNRILTNLQKLQHENDVLKNKIKMLQYMRHKPIKSDPDFEQFLQHEMFENNILFDSPQKVENNFKPRNMLINKGKNHDVKRSEIEVLDYDNLEINDSDDTFLEAENVSKGAKEVQNVCSDQSPQSGKETYRKKETKPEFNVYRYSQEVNTPKPHQTKEKNSGKDAKKAEKKRAKKAKKEKKRKMQRIAAIDEDYETFQINNNNEMDDWYNKLYDGRQTFREKGLDYYIWQNKAKWYFKRMNRQKYRRNHQKYKVYTPEGIF